MIEIECDRCGRRFEATPSSEGKATCPVCGDVNRVRFDAATSATPVAERPTPRRDDGRISVADETTLLVVRPALFRAHPFAYGGLILLAFVGVVVMVLPLFSLTMSFVALLGLALVVAAVIGFLRMFVFSHRWFRLKITDRRTIDERGIVTRRHSEVLHDHAVNIRISQTVWQRLMKLGDFEIESAAGGSVDPDSGERSSTEISIKNIPDPYGVKALIDSHRRT